MVLSHRAKFQLIINFFRVKAISTGLLGSTRTLVTLLRPWIRRFTMIISAGGFKQEANSVNKNSKKSTGTLDHWKLLSRCGFLQARSNHCNTKCADRPIFSVRRYLVTGG